MLTHLFVSLKMLIPDISDKKVLILDEEVDFCKLIRFYLEKHNCTVLVAHTIQHALQIIDNETPEVVIIDQWFNRHVELIKSKLPGVTIVRFPNTTMQSANPNKPESTDLALDWNHVLFVACVLLLAFLTFQYFSHN